MTLPISIDREKCMGSGNCSFHAPGVFDLDDALKAVVLDASAEPDDAVRLAAEACPTGAITISGDGGPAAACPS